MNYERRPETDSLGLVLPTSFRWCAFVQWGRTYEVLDKDHHLYHSKARFAISDLAWQFREHPINTVHLNYADHTRVHQEQDGVLVPPNIVMEAALVVANRTNMIGCLNYFSREREASLHDWMEYHKNVAEHLKSLGLLERAINEAAQASMPFLQPAEVTELAIAA